MPGRPALFVPLLGILNSGFLNPQRIQELGEGDAVCLCRFADGLAAGDSTTNTAHAELEEGFGCLWFCLKELVNGTVSGNFCHTVLSLLLGR